MTDMWLSMQHLYSFIKILEAQKQQAKRHLDCAGVVIAILATCQHLAKREKHADLAACRLQVHTRTLISQQSNSILAAITQ